MSEHGEHHHHSSHHHHHHHHHHRHRHHRHHHGNPERRYYCRESIRRAKERSIGSLAGFLGVFILFVLAVILMLIR